MTNGKKKNGKRSKRGTRKRAKGGGGSQVALVSIPRRVRANNGLSLNPLIRPPRARGEYPNIRLGSVAVEKVCSQLDPFCPAAVGAKYPDMFGTRTVTYQTRVLKSATTGASSDGYFLFTPDISDCVYASAAFATNPNTFAAGASVADSSLTTWLSGVSDVRVVSAGVRFIPTLAATASPFLFHIIEIPDPTPIWNNASFDASQVSIYGSYPSFVNSNENWCWTASPRDKDYRELLPQSRATTTLRSGIWNALLVGIVGTASSGCGYFELVINYEGEPKVVVAGGSNPNYTRLNAELANYAAPNPVVTSAAEHVRTMTGGIFKGTTEAFGRQVQRLAAMAIDKGAGMVARRFGMGGMYSAIMNVD